MKELTPRNCHDCGARPGEPHDPGCDLEKCPECGMQLISCGHDRPEVPILWSGIWPGKEDCRRLGFWCRPSDHGGYEECSPDDPNAMENLNRLYYDAKWDKETRRWELKTEADRIAEVVDEEFDEDFDEDYAGWCYNEGVPIFHSSLGNEAWLTGCMLCGSSDCRPRSKEDEDAAEEWYRDNMTKPKGEQEDEQSDPQ